MQIYTDNKFTKDNLNSERFVVPSNDEGILIVCNDHVADLMEAQVSLERLGGEHWTFPTYLKRYLKIYSGGSNFFSIDCRNLEKEARYDVYTGSNIELFLVELFHEVNKYSISREGNTLLIGNPKIFAVSCVRQSGIWAISMFMSGIVEFVFSLSSRFEIGDIIAGIDNRISDQIRTQRNSDLYFNDQTHFNLYLRFLYHFNLPSDIYKVA